MYAKDGQADGRTKATLIAPFPTVAGHNKSHKMPYCAMLREVEKWSGIHIQGRITTKSKPILPIGRPNQS